MTREDDPRRGSSGSAASSTRQAAEPNSNPFDTQRTPTAASAMSAQLGKVTEVHLVNTAFGLAKLQETSKDRSFLIMRALPAGSGLVPYVDRGAIVGAYRVQPDHAMPLGPGVLRYPVLEVVPALFIEEADRCLVLAELAAAGLTLHFAEDQDQTASVRQELVSGELLWKSHAAAGFSLEALVRDLHEVRSSLRFDGVFVVRGRSGARHLLAVGRTLPSVLRLHTYFEQVDQREAVRLRLGSGEEAWLARLADAP